MRTCKLEKIALVILVSSFTFRKREREREEGHIYFYTRHRGGGEGGRARWCTTSKWILNRLADVWREDEKCEYARIALTYFFPFSSPRIYTHGCQLMRSCVLFLISYVWQKKSGIQGEFYVVSRRERHTMSEWLIVKEKKISNIFSRLLIFLPLSLFFSLHFGESLRARCGTRKTITIGIWLCEIKTYTNAHIHTHTKDKRTGNDGQGFVVSDCNASEHKRRKVNISSLRFMAAY